MQTERRSPTTLRPRFPSPNTVAETALKLMCTFIVFRIPYSPFLPRSPSASAAQPYHNGKVIYLRNINLNPIQNKTLHTLLLLLVLLTTAEASAEVLCCACKPARAEVGNLLQEIGNVSFFSSQPRKTQLLSTGFFLNQPQPSPLDRS